MFEDRLRANKPASAQQRLEEISKNANLSKEAQAEQLQRAAEIDIAESLFADLNDSTLNLEKDYMNFGKKVGGVLYQGQAPYRIPSFFKELVRDLAKQTDSKKIKEILDSVTAIYNEKVKEEKEKDKGNKSVKPAKAQLKSGKQH